MTKPTERGREFERETCDVLNADLVPGSGNQWFAKLDLEDAGKILLSLKWTGADRFIVGPKLLSEVNDAIHAPGGVGSTTVGGTVIGLQDKAYAIFELGDLANMLSERTLIARQSKAEARRERSRKSILARAEEEE